MKAYSAFVFGVSATFLAALGIFALEEGAHIEPSQGVLWFITGVALTASAIGWAKFDD